MDFGGLNTQKQGCRESIVFRVMDDMRNCVIIRVHKGALKDKSYWTLMGVKYFSSKIGKP
jgi:hypothetical protein